MQPTVVILGASPVRSKFSYKALKAHLLRDYIVYPVNPRATEIDGIPCFARYADVPQPVDRVAVYLPPLILYQELDNLAAAPPGEILLSPGTFDDSVLQKASELGLTFRKSCSIVELGFLPVDL